MTVPVHCSGVCLHERDYARAHALCQPAPGQRLCKCVVRGGDQEAQELAIPHKIRPQALGNGERPEAVWYGQENIFLYRLNP